MPPKGAAKITGERSPAGKAGAGKSAVGSWGEREDGILSVARDLFIRNGYESTSMAAVAAAAGLSEGTLYNYFHNKTDLVLRVTLANLELRVEAAARAVDEATSLREGLEKLIALHLSAIIHDEEVYRIWLREVRGVKSYRRSPSRDALARFANQFVRLLDRFGHTQDRPDGPTRAMMREMIFGGSEHIGFTAIVQRRADRIDVEATAAQLADVYLRGFGFDG
jgi:TetR/AcrR family transcriptional regulator, fatty acid metabolism regulator protein